MKKKALFPVVILALFVCAMTGIPEAMAAANIKIGHVNAKSHPAGSAQEAFKAKVEEVSKGAVQVRSFHSAALGSDPDLIQGCQLGNVEMASANIGSFSTFAKEFDIVSLPFLFRDEEHLHRVMDGELGKILADVAEKKLGIKIVGWSTSAQRQIFCKVPIRTVADLKGKKIRTMDDAGIIEVFKLFGAIPSPIAFGEIYSALQSGVIDGGESSFLSWVNSRFTEVAKYCSEVNYMDTGRAFFINKKFYDSLSADDRRAVDEGVKVMINTVRTEYINDAKTVKEKAAAAGGVVITPDIASFRQAAMPIYDKRTPTLGKEWIEKIRNVQ